VHCQRCGKNQIPFAAFLADAKRSIEETSKIFHGAFDFF